MAQGENQRTRDQMSEDERAIHIANGREGGITTKTRYGPDHYSRIGKMGRAKQLSGEPSAPKKAKGGTSGKRPSRLRTLAEAVQTDEDPLSSVL